MARYLDAQTRERHTIANRSIELCTDLLANPQIQQATDGLAEEAESFLPLLYVPNMRDGHYQISGRKYDGYGIPCVITLPGEQAKILRLAKYALHPIQREGIGNAIYAVEGEERNKKQYEKIISWIIKSYQEGVGDQYESLKDEELWGACVYSPPSAIGLSDMSNPSVISAYSVDTSPVVFMKASTHEIDNSGDILFHEMIHVKQSLKNIIYKTSRQDATLKRYELEAYSNQAKAQEIHYMFTVEENPWKWQAPGIESIRRIVNAESKDPYRVTRELLDQIKRAGWELD
ncbi:MAG: hypothetical protein WAW80_02765 [Candidatus Saccharimonadales bacterium]